MNTVYLAVKLYLSGVLSVNIKSIIKTTLAYKGQDKFISVYIRIRRALPPTKGKSIQANHLPHFIWGLHWGRTWWRASEEDLNEWARLWQAAFQVPKYQMGWRNTGENFSVWKQTGGQCRSHNTGLTYQHCGMSPSKSCHSASNLLEDRGLQRQHHEEHFTVF